MARRLLMHPDVELVRVASIDHVGEPLGAVHPNLDGATDLVFEDLSPTEAAKGCDVALLALPHKVTAAKVPELIAAELDREHDGPIVPGGDRIARRVLPRPGRGDPPAVGEHEHDVGPFREHAFPHRGGHPCEQVLARVGRGDAVGEVAEDLVRRGAAAVDDPICPASREPVDRPHRDPDEEREERGSDEGEVQEIVFTDEITVVEDQVATGPDPSLSRCLQFLAGNECCTGKR